MLKITYVGKKIVSGDLEIVQKTHISPPLAHRKPFMRAHSTQLKKKTLINIHRNVV